MSENGKTITPRYRAVVFCDDAAVRELFRKVLSRRGYEVLTFAAYEFPEKCSIFQHLAELCTKDNRCADMVILSRHILGLRAIDFLEEQARKGCRLTPKNKLIIASSYEAKEEERVNKLGASIMYMPLVLEDLNEWLDACEKRLAS